MDTTKTELLRTIIKELGGNRIFGCTFVKRSNGEVRDMTCRLGVSKGLVGGELPFCPVEKGLLPVFDMTKQDYRMINLETLTEIRANGQVYKFEN
jgi:hypothetical protein